MSGFSTARQKMVDGQVRTNDVTDRRILDAMLTVPREVFVPAGRQALAYLDLDLDVSEGAAKRFLIKPALTGKLLQAAQIGEGDNVLVVGCASGYLAALIAKFARQVTATECDSALAAKAKDIIAKLGLANVTCEAAACTEGDATAAPYDVIILNGATEVTPEGLLAQLKDGGRLVGVSAESKPPRAMIVTHSHGDFGHRTLFDASAPVLPGLERAAAFVF
ncbi:MULTISPECIES: protein-L-isoaspartate O-methyltransferase [unclassified Bradyrhizobium]|uniref:protein-L-isoaspartate O-methyltransferase family protein n=1 Tax=unclassified Bradyrhizobium TaxID=2631580 RepID=UPI00247AF289|nr:MULTISPECIES: protein-L-isoaspartate O-methyltransferase [unclassified Bradyrhizobium]WGR67973.1 protein-L-isoaspartate O-methyltransferase [Bradyrhizobium sp. ISRA426]WGR80027.1 protein-L-isoaspartate O-methyltransferase [Bradyrhizobium sp. ISRA430]WGR83212.1 protein-L-isoaspartate O-methyltransferase [Bradyrhizobium sp. ISRA432]